MSQGLVFLPVLWTRADHSARSWYSLEIVEPCAISPLCLCLLHIWSDRVCYEIKSLDAKRLYAQTHNLVPYRNPSPYIIIESWGRLAYPEMYAGVVAMSTC
jgi:hypothetical protein